METEQEGGRHQSLVCWARGRVRTAQSDGVVGGGKTGDRDPPHPTWPLLLTTSARLQVYPSSSGDDYGRDSTAYPSTKTPSSAYPPPFYMAGAWGLT